MSYFPRTAAIPEEIFFCILGNLHPGFVWLFCRVVARRWRLHVERNIARYINLFARKVKYQRARREERGDEHVDTRWDGDALYVEVSWTDALETKLAYLTLRMEDLEIPPPPEEEQYRNIITTDKCASRVFFKDHHDAMVFGYSPSQRSWGITGGACWV